MSFQSFALVLITRIRETKPYIAGPNLTTLEPPLGNHLAAQISLGMHTPH